MRLLAAVVAALGLVFLTISPANAAPCPSPTTVNGLGLVCVTADGGNAEINIISPTGRPLLSTSVPLPANAPITVTIPGPTVKAPGPTSTITITSSGPRATATVTKAGSASTQTITVTKSGTVTKTQKSTATSTNTATATATATATVTQSGQGATASATLAGKTAAPTLTEPPRAGSEEDTALPIIPKDPKTAAATGGFLGVAFGILLGIIGLFIAYRRGQIEGEKATLQEFLGVIRGEPQTGRHRVD